MAWKGISVDRIIAKFSGGKIGHESKSFYTNPYGTVDFTSDDDIPNKRAIMAWIGSGGGGGPSLQVVVPFALVTNLVINWQTDTPAGYPGTYAALLGNDIPKPVVDSVPDSGSPNSYKRIPALITYTTDGAGSILTVTIDWSTSQSGNIIF